MSIRIPVFEPKNKEFELEVASFRTAGTVIEEHILLKVKDQQGSEVQYIIKKSTPLRGLMAAYCKRLGLEKEQVHFMLNGKRIAPEDTAEKLGLEDKDLIGASTHNLKILLTVMDQQGSDLQYQIKKSTPLQGLMVAYCLRFRLQQVQVHFMVNGKRIAPHDTAEKLGLEDKGLIDASTRDLKYGATPLHFAVWRGSAELTRHLINIKADPNATDKDGQTPWAWAEVKDDETMMELLSGVGAGPSPVLSVSIEPSPGEILLSCTSLAGHTMCHRGFPEDARIAEVLEHIAQETGKAATLVLPSHRVLGLGDDHLTLAQVLDTPTELEKRQAEDGCSYTRQQFMKYFGKATGELMWSKAVPDEEETALAASLVEAAEVENENISEALIRSRIEPVKVHLCRYGGG